MQTTAQTTDKATLRALAVEASADPRTVARRLRGEPVKGMARHRVDAVLRAHGLLSEEAGTS